MRKWFSETIKISGGADVFVLAVFVLILTVALASLHGAIWYALFNVVLNPSHSEWLFGRQLSFVDSCFAAITVDTAIWLGRSFIRLCR